MRLANDLDQEIIRSAIPNSSISTTSFISSIGNGEAIAFGEAVAVPMRMRFTRVDEKHLPKANGVSVKITDETPDTVDLRSIVSRMRAMNGPDISNFQQSYSTGNGNPERDLIDEDDYLEESPAEFHPPLRTQANTEVQAAAEPYNPAMLPRAEPANPQLERFNQIRSQILSDQPLAAPPADPYRTQQRTPPSFGQPGMDSRTDALRPDPYRTEPARPDPSRFEQARPDQPRPSLRESLLKKPLSSIIRK
jgi:hypothetical protein